MNRQLGSAVLATFRPSDEVGHRRSLQSFPLQAWRKTLYWLDASGLALYFLRELKAQRIEDAIPSGILSQLERRSEQNIERTRFLFEEFARINGAFRAAGLQYVNLKGFTLTPDYCPDLSLRYQTDCDFLMNRSDAERCRQLLKPFGYDVVAANDHVLELKTDIGVPPRIEDLYTTRPERSVEIHVTNAGRADRHPDLIKRSRQIQIDGSTYPALSREDTFLSQAWHLFRHVRSEWTRISWLLEFRHFVLRHRGNVALWSDVERRTNQSGDGGLALGFVVSFAEAVLGSFAPEELTRWSLPQVPPDAASWVVRYANKVALTNFPGSKLYLLLEQTLSAGAPASSIRCRLFPTHAPAPVVIAPSAGLVQRTRAFASRTGYFCFRLKFHLKATLQFVYERSLWGRDRRNYLPQTRALSSRQRRLNEVHD